MIRAFLVGLIAALVLVSPAAACKCIDTPLSKRLDESDAAVVGIIVAQRPGQLRGAPQKIFTVHVEQHVKGDLPRVIDIRSPSGTDCDVDVPLDKTVGLLLVRGPNQSWLATACSVVDPGYLVAAGGEPRGGPVKVVIGMVVLGLVLLWAFFRLRKGARPNLPGAPEP